MSQSEQTDGVVPNKKALERDGDTANHGTSETRLLQLQFRLLRDSHLDLKIETLKENSRLILDLDSQILSESSHSHSQLSAIF